MARRHFFFKGIFFILSSSTFADPITWVAQSPANDMNDSDNWDPDSVPISVDDAIFDSSIPGIATNPTESFAPFSVLTFQFPNQASVFNFQFNNKTLSFTGDGITGTNTNPVINIANIDNGGFPGDLISFVGTTGTSGSANITCTNSATLTGSQPGVGLGAINSNFFSAGPFTIASGGVITASNMGNNSTIDTGNNGVANTGSSQVRFDESFTAGDNVSVSVSNSGTFSGVNSAQGDSAAIVNGSQFISTDAFIAGDNFSCIVQNSGNDSSNGIGLSNIGQINAAQMILQRTAAIGNNCTISVANTGTNSSHTSGFSDSVGYLNDEQFFAGNTFQAGDRFNFTVTNTGTDSSTGHGGSLVAAINSNSGTTGNQALFQQGAALGNQATIGVTNSGTYTGTNTNGGPNVGLMNLGQLAIGDSGTIGSFAFNVGDQFALNVSNGGTDSAVGVGNDAVGTISTNQVSIFSPAVLGNNASMIITNSGNFSGQSTSSFVNVGSVGSSQLGSASTFRAGDNFTLNITNSGTNTGSGVGNNFIGDIVNGQQAGFNNGLVVGNNASITISNNGTNSSSTSSHNQTGSFMGYGKQLLVRQPFQAGENLLVEITNTGLDESTNGGGNFVGFINNNTADGSGSQMHLGGGTVVGNRATITVSNTGTCQGSTDTNIVAALSGQQFYSADSFQSGDNFGFTVSNTATNNGSGHTNNSVGTLGGPQVQFGSSLTVGNQAAFIITNNGINQDAGGTSNNIGMTATQMLVEGIFTAGANLNINVRNQGINAGDVSNNVGLVNGSQISFEDTCTLNDQSSITAFNSGRVNLSQIEFGQGFDVASGKVTIQAVNDGTVGAFGINILGSNAGGDAEIILGNSSLNIGTTLPTFTIGGLQGDSTSTAQSQPTLVINTDGATKTEFSGVIQDFPATMSTLTKTGPGIQILSGDNTYTGLTTVQEGMLVVNGSLSEDVLIISPGTLKGNGMIGGTVTNTGTLAPGQSIGTLNVGSYANNGGTYNVEVNGVGQSSLINSTGAATLSGGMVVVSSVDGSFRLQQPYTIITAQGGVIGTFSGATSLAFINPILTYSPNNVFLTINSALINAASACNQRGVAATLDNLRGLSAAQTLLIGAIANLPRRQAQSALESLSGFQYTNGVWATEITTRRFLRRLYDPLRPIVSTCDCCCPDWTLWLEGGYGFTNLHKKTAHKLHMDSYQVTGGIQKTFCCDFTVGLAGSYEYDQMKYRHGKGHRNSGYASLYGLYRPCCFYGLVDFVYGYTADHVDRKIQAGTIRYKAQGKPHQNLFAFYGELGFDWCACCLLIQPFVGVQVDSNWRGHIGENDAGGFGLDIKKHHWTETSTRLGVHITSCDICDCFNASLDLAWEELWTSDDNSTRGRFKQFGNSFRICGNELDRASFDYALTLSSCFCDCFTGYIELGGEVWSHANTFNVILGVEYDW